VADLAVVNREVCDEDEYLALAAEQAIKNALAPTLSVGKFTIRSVWVSATSGAFGKSISRFQDFCDKFFD
jgi:hypothetical protein